jgi:MoxR-like ATPase
MTRRSVLREKVSEVYGYISETLYFNRPDLTLGGGDYNSALLFSLFTALNGGAELIIGEPGLGKTSSAEYASSLVYQLPLEVIWNSEVHGHPEQTEEKIIGRPDLGKLNQGVEKVLWTSFSQLPVKIVDEINRLPETKQSVILDGVDRGNWRYLNAMLIIEEQSLFATANYQDRGTNELLPPMCDRFDVVVESKYPGANHALRIAEKGREPLRSPEHAAAFERVLNEKRPYLEKLPELERLSREFGAHLQEEGIASFDKEERGRIRRELRRLKLDIDASAFFRVLLSELSFCPEHGQKRTHETCPSACPFREYLCYDVRNCASNRLPVSAIRYSRALAWFLGAERVTIEHIKTVVPYALAHRTRWRNEFLTAHEGDRREDPLQIHLSRVGMEEVLNRYRANHDAIKSAFRVSSEILRGEKGCEDLPSGNHPIFHELRKDLDCS